MQAYEIRIEWEGPLKLQAVIDKKNDTGAHPDWDGNDYGLYQIYGRHILYKENTLLYIGMTTEQTFSQRFTEHGREWLTNDQDEKDINIYLGRIYDPKKHSKKDNWLSWKKDVEMAEKILIYKYSPNYNSECLTNEPDLFTQENVRLIHKGDRNRLHKEDIVPRDFREW